MADMEFEDIQAVLSTASESTPSLISRRTVLKAIAAGVGISMLPGWLQDTAWAAPALGPSDGVLVLIQMGGGNDGLNTVVPTGLGKYYDLRKGLAVSQNSALGIGPGVGLHPSLTKLKARFDTGKVAVVQGAGYKNPDLSHFNSMATWMSGWAPQQGIPRTGWLGRYLDGLGTDPLYGVTLGTSVPLHMQGERTAATVLPANKDHLMLGGNSYGDDTRRLLDGIRNFATTSTGLGPLVDKCAMTASASTDAGRDVNVLYRNPELPSGNFNAQLALVSRLINANIGARVFSVTFGSFDTHSGQSGSHAYLLAQLDTAIETFFSTLDSQMAGRVALMTFSEFGRRPQLNKSGGTDHGTASPLFVIGDRVRGGLYGAQPSLTDLDENGNLKPSVDFRSVYGSVLAKWLNAGDKQLLGSSFEQLDVFTGPPSGETIPPPALSPAPASPAPVVAPLPSARPISFPRAYRIATAAGVVTSYGGAESHGNANAIRPIVGVATTPNQHGYWLASADGGVFSYGNAPFHGSAGNLRLNAPIVGLASTAGGKGYWLLGKDGGIFSYGDAAFYGSTGSMRLNQPVVGMAATPGGRGYWLVASDGGIFAFGDARFHGSTGSMRLNQPIVGMAATPGGGGYWLVASDGGIFAFGDARFHGSTGSIKLNKPIVGMAATPTGQGYRLVASDGGVFCFGDATFEGSLGGGGSGSPVIGIVT